MATMRTQQMFAISNFHFLVPWTSLFSFNSKYCQKWAWIPYQLFQEKLDKYAFVQLILKIIIFYYKLSVFRHRIASALKYA